MRLIATLLLSVSLQGSYRLLPVKPPRTLMWPNSPLVKVAAGTSQTMATRSTATVLSACCRNPKADFSVSQHSVRVKET